MKAKHIFIISFILMTFARAGISQPWYFNEIYNPNNTWAMGLSIIATDSGYFGCSVSPQTDPGYLCANTFVLNLNGEMTQWHSFGREGANFYSGDEGSLTACNDGFGLFGSAHDYQNDSVYGVFYKFDQYGDTIFTKLFDNANTYNSLAGRTCTSTSDGGFALAGTVNLDYGFLDIILIKIDSNGNEQWRTYFGTDLSDWVKSIIQTSDGGYAIGSWSRIPWELETADPVVFKTDSLGTLEWTLNLGGPFLDDRAMLCNTPDSCIMVLTTIADSMFNPQFADNRTAFIKINLQGDTLWTKKYKTSQTLNYISNIISTHNGNFLACGTSQISVALPNAGWLFRLNSNGDSLWYRDYYYYPEGTSYGSNYLSDVSLTSDNGFVATGDASTIYPPENENKIWVIKVDSVGCEIPNCWVGIEEEGETWGSGEEGKRGNLVVWPNPAQGIVDCRWSNFDFRGDFSLVIYDMFGREMMNISVPENEREIQFEVGNYSPGLYLVVLKDESNIIGSLKLVISR
jgi:hypothetical protein